MGRGLSIAIKNPGYAGAAEEVLLMGRKNLRCWQVFTEKSRC